MTETEIITMARQAGYAVPAWRDHIEMLSRFAALVANRERKLCINDCHEFANHLRGFQDKKGAEIVDGVAAVIAARCDKEPA